MSDDEDDHICPICMDPLDMTDRSFSPCDCGYQVCIWCFHHIKENLNNKCPACRNTYKDFETIVKQSNPASITKQKTEKKDKTKKKKQEDTTASRKHLQNVRVVQHSLVYVIGLSPAIAKEEVLRRNEFFGQYGRIQKIVVNRSHVHGGGDPGGPSYSAYITFTNKEDAVAAIQAVDGCTVDGRVLRASFGTTKYCSFFLRGQTCTLADCMYLHDIGQSQHSFTKEDLAAGKVAGYVSALTRSAISKTPSRLETETTSQTPSPLASPPASPSLSSIPQPIGHPFDSHMDDSGPKPSPVPKDAIPSSVWGRPLPDSHPPFQTSLSQPSLLTQASSQPSTPSIPPSLPQPSPAEPPTQSQQFTVPQPVSSQPATPQTTPSFMARPMVQDPSDRSQMYPRSYESLLPAPLSCSLLQLWSFQQQTTHTNTPQPVSVSVPQSPHRQMYPSPAGITPQSGATQPPWALSVPPRLPSGPAVEDDPSDFVFDVSWTRSLLDDEVELPSMNSLRLDEQDPFPPRSSTQAASFDSFSAFSSRNSSSAPPSPPQSDRAKARNVAKRPGKADKPAAPPGWEDLQYSPAQGPQSAAPQNQSPALRFQQPHTSANFSHQYSQRPQVPNVAAMTQYQAAQLQTNRMLPTQHVGAQHMMPQTSVGQMGSYNQQMLRRDGYGMDQRTQFPNNVSQPQMAGYPNLHHMHQTMPQAFMRPAQTMDMSQFMHMDSHMPIPPHYPQAYAQSPTRK